MRIDLALKYLCLAKSRSSVKTLCDESRLTINGRPAKAATAVHVGDEIHLSLPGRHLAIRLLDVPQKQLSKSSAPSYYQIVADDAAD